MNSAERSFWRFVAARQQAWAHRVIGSAPAVDDAVLSRAKFTNVFRALDRGTLFSIYELLFTADAAARVWAVVMYRAMNRTDSFLELIARRGGMPWFSGRNFLRAAREWRASGGKVFTGVYQSSAVIQVVKGGEVRGGMDGRLAVLGEELADAAPRLAAAISAAHSVEATIRLIRGATARMRLGPFAAHQAALDLDYSENFGDDWVYVGPGAKAALGLIYGGGHGDIDAVRGLVAAQPKIPWAPLSRGSSVRLEAADVEHALCEWQKYERIAEGGHAKGIYRQLPAGEWRPPSPVPPWWTIPKG